MIDGVVDRDPNGHVGPTGERRRRDSALPLAGVRVVELTHMVMGPTCGMILADLGAEVIKVEPPGGDATRRLLGSGAGFFATFNRNKKSLSVDLAKEGGRELLLQLVATADVFVENFKPGAMARLGLGYDTLSAGNSRLIYVSHKGFLPGPYEHRTALDEVVQMMGGLAYMTGPQGMPLRAGSSVNDIMGGLFGAIGAMAALAQRERDGRGQLVQSALFENNVFLVAQHMMQFAVTGVPAAPMPNRVSAWGVYDVFTVASGEQLFVAVVSDAQWSTFCRACGFGDLAADPRLTTNNDRVRAREWLMPMLRARLADRSAGELIALLDTNGLPYAPIVRPHELFDDPHLGATDGLFELRVPADASGAGRSFTTRVAPLPITLGHARLPVRSGPPGCGEHTDALLSELGYSAQRVQQLRSAGVLGPVR